MLRIHLATLTGGQSVAPAQPQVVASHFNDYADTVDRHLVGGLKYRAPQLIHEAVTAARQRAGADAEAGEPGRLDVVDLGCGTGLCGPLFRPIARTLVGVDLALRMIHEARQRRVYDELLVDEITNYLSARPARFDLAIAADVLNYFGDLSCVLAAAARSLRPGGLLAFTVEKHDREGYVLNPTRRFAHSLQYVRSQLSSAGLDEVSSGQAVLRRNKGKEVIGLVFVARNT
jgi:predicted TPR repeat methyltransferase